MRRRTPDLEPLRVIDAVLAQQLERRPIADELGDRLLAHLAHEPYERLDDELIVR